MKYKVLSIIMALCLILPFSFVVFANEITTVAPNQGDMIGYIPYANFNEPPELSNTCYWVLDENYAGSSNIDKCSHAYLFVLVFPFLEQSIVESEITVNLYLQQGKQTLKVSGPNLAGNPFYCYVYNLNGQYLNAYNWTFPTYPTEFSYSFTFSGSAYRYWFKGPINMKLEYSSYNPASIVWKNETVYTSQLRDIMTQLNYLYAVEYAQGTVESNFFDLYLQAFNAFRANNYSQLLNILDGVQIIINLLGGQQQITTIPDESNLGTEVSDYIDTEHEYMSDYQDAFGDVEPLLTDVNTLLSDNSNGFTAIRLLFHNFVEDIPLSYVCLLFSLTFGAIALIIGRVIPRLRGK